MNGNEYYLWSHFLFGVVVCASSAVCLAKGLHILKSIRTTNLLSEWDQDALLICWGFCILSCTEFQWNSVSLAIILIVLTTMILTGTRGLYGSFVASMLSATWVIYAKADARIVAIATLGAALSVPFYRQGRIWIIAAHLASALLIVAVQPELAQGADELLQREVAGAADIDVADIPLLHDLVHDGLGLCRDRAVEHTIPLLEVIAKERPPYGNRSSACQYGAKCRVRTCVSEQVARRLPLGQLRMRAVSGPVSS